MSQTSETGTVRRLEVANFCSFCGYKFLVNDNRCSNCGKLRQIKRTSPQGQWQRVLYEKPAFDDNYVDPTFLSTLKHPPKPPRLIYQELFLSSVELSMAIAAISLFLICYYYMLKKKVSTEIVIGVYFVFLLLGAFLMIIFSPKMVKLKKIAHHFKGGTLVLGCVFMISPVSMTFYSNFADNTTYFLASVLIIIHLIGRDYGYGHPESDSTINVDVSIYAALYLSVILGSRLGDSFDICGIIYLILSIISLFIFLRLVLKAIRSFSTKGYYSLAFTVIVVMLIPIFKISKIFMIIYILLNFLVLVVSPIALMYFYQYKKYYEKKWIISSVIEGPWDLPNIQKHDDED